MLSLYQYFVILWITAFTQIQGDNFIYDYFAYKNIQRMTLFSCEEPQNDLELLRKMNDLNIFVNVGHPQWNSYNVCDHVPRKTDRPVGLLLDMRCQAPETNEKIFEQTTECHLYDLVHIWLVLASNIDEITELLNDTAYSTHTDLVIAIENEEGYELYDVYNPDKRAGGILNITAMGSWNPENGLVITLSQSKYYRRANLHGMEIRAVAVIKYQPHGIPLEDYLQDNTQKNKDFVTKYGYAILQHLADLYNYSMVIHPVSEWAVMINGTEQGMMPELSRSNVDLTMTTCSANKRYASYGQPSVPGYPWRTFFLLRSNFEKFKWSEFLTPLGVDSWCALGIASILAIGIVSTIQMIEYKEGWTTELGHSSFAILGIICQQGLVFVPNKLSGRVALLFLLFFGVLLLNYYGASVVSARLSEPPDKMNDSLYSLALSGVKVSSEPYYIVDDNLNSRGMIEWEVRYFNEKVWKKLSLSRFVNVDEGLDKVAKGGYAYHTSAEVAYPYVETHWDDNAICEMTEIHVLTPRMLSFYQRANSPFNEMIKIGLMKTSNAGLQSRTIKRWKPKTPYCSPLARSVQSVTFFEIAPAVLLIIFGTATSLIILLIEIILFKIYPNALMNNAGPKVQRTGGKKTLLRN